MFTVNLGMLLFLITTVISGNKEPCKRIPINSDQMYGECCVFNKNESVKYEKNNIYSPKPITDHPRPPEIPKNVVLSIDNNKVYGECSIYIKDENLRHESRKTIAAIIIKNLSLTDNTEEKGPLSNQKPQKIITQNQIYSNSNTVSNVPDVSKLLETSTIEAEITYPGNVLNKRKDFHQHKVKSPTTGKYGTNKPLFFTDTTEETLIPTRIANKSDESVLMIFQNDNSSDIMFPTEESILTTIKSPNVSKTSLGKTIIDVGNRNAVDVPPIGCPTGQSRDPSGKCVSPF